MRSRRRTSSWRSPTQVVTRKSCTSKTSTAVRGLRIGHLMQACLDEFAENEDLPNTTNPDDWAKISGKKGERIVFIRTLISSKQGTQPGRSIDTVSNTGQYL